jgi:cob(I)alamin adenosyltransferase
MLYTRKGDTGTSGLFGTKDRQSKASPIFEALGMTDELNSLLGFARSFGTLNNFPAASLAAPLLRSVQESLFIVQAELAGAQKNLTQEHVDKLEAQIAELEAQIENPHSFIVPGATAFSGLLDVARAVSRRVERTIIRSEAPLSPTTKAYLNRLSSFLYALARVAAKDSGEKEQSPSYLA